MRDPYDAEKNLCEVKGSYPRTSRSKLSALFDESTPPFCVWHLAEQGADYYDHCDCWEVGLPWRISPRQVDKFIKAVVRVCVCVALAEKSGALGSKQFRTLFRLC